MSNNMNFSEEDLELVLRAVSFYMDAVADNNPKAVSMVEDDADETLAELEEDGADQDEINAAKLAFVKDELGRGRNIATRIIGQWLNLDRK